MADYSISIRKDTPTAPFPHYWEGMVGSDRAAITLRADWQQAMQTGVERCGFQTVRFQGLLDDEMGVYRTVDGATKLRTLYMDQCFDMLLAMGVKPFVNLSYTPLPLASGSETVNWWAGNITPPNDMDAWSSLMGDIAAHLLSRYGADEIATWRFEVWNEPNLSFTGTQEQYFELYAATAKAFKAVSAKFQVGGPATAQIQWIGSFLDWCSRNSATVDFVSTHVYPGDPQLNLFGNDLKLPSQEIVPAAIRCASARVKGSAFPDVPLIISEWGAQNPAFIAETIRSCQGTCDILGYWDISTIFEETGPVQAFDSQYFGLLDQGNVPRTSLHIFTLLHQMSATKYATGYDMPLMATQQPDGSLSVMFWNLPNDSDVAKMGTPGVYQDFSFVFPDRTGPAEVTIIDPATFGVDVLYNQWGRPPSPTEGQMATLLSAGAMPPAKSIALTKGTATISLPPNAVGFLTIS